MTATKIEIGGTADARFGHLRDLLQGHLSAGSDLGASIAVEIDGKPVVDLWGGWRDAAGTRAWERDTVVNLWSTSKTITNLAALVLVDRGLIEADAPVCRIWPEFAAAGKEAVELRHILSHGSGLAGWDPPFSLAQMYDCAGATARLAAQAPWWQPGKASGYHALTQGHLVGEIVRRVTGSTLTDFVAEALCGPLGADLRIGAGGVAEDRIAEIVPPPEQTIAVPDGIDPSIMIRTFTAPRFTAAEANTAAWRGAELGAANMHGNARAVARVLSALTLAGTSAAPAALRLGADTARLARTEQIAGVDMVLGIPIRWATGFALPDTATLSWLPPLDGVFWGGWGGSFVLCDFARRMTFAYVMNKMQPGIIGSTNSRDYVTAVLDALV
jgi:CubicO group peptidase (beta-lactamase class C family)